MAFNNNHNDDGTVFGFADETLEDETPLSLYELIELEEWRSLEHLLEANPQQAAVKLEVSLFSYRTVELPLFAVLRKSSVPVSTIYAFLMAHPPAIHTRESTTGGLALHVALRSNYASSLDIVKALVHAHVSALQVADMDGNLPLHIAANKSTSDVTLFLLAADPTCAQVRNDKGQLALHKAVGRCESPENVIQALIRTHPEGACISDSSGRLPLHVAATWRATPSIVQLLADAHPEAVHIKDIAGNTPYRLARRMARLPAEHGICQVLRRTMRTTGSRRQRLLARLYTGAKDTSMSLSSSSPPLSVPSRGNKEKKIGKKRRFRVSKIHIDGQSAEKERYVVDSRRGMRMSEV